jgi:DNA-binding transcriptional LysR family regulator
MRYTTFRQLEVFEAIARHSSFTRAAEELFLAQPTVSMQMKKLADGVGLPLFEQIGRKIYLTDAGRELHTASREIFERLRVFHVAVANMKGLNKGTLRISVVTTAEYFAPRLLGPFCEAHPGVEVSLKVTNRETILARFAGNEDDLYILGRPPAELDAVAEPFLENPLVVLAAADHPLASRQRIPLARLAQESFILREAGSGTRIATLRTFTQHGLKVKVRMVLGSNEAIKQAVVGGLGVSVLSRHTLSVDATMGHIAILDVEGFPIVGHWYVAYPAGKQLSVVAKTFLDYLKSAENLSELSCRHALLGQCPLIPGDRPERRARR